MGHAMLSRSVYVEILGSVMSTGLLKGRQLRSGEVGS